MLRLLGVAYCLLVASHATTVAQAPKGAPPQQTAFLSVVQSARQVYSNAQNDMQKGSARPTRARGICEILRSLRVERWAGTVTELTTNSEGRGIVSIDIGEKVLVKTWNNSFSDMSDKTLLDPNGRIFSIAVGLRKGDLVVFSGHFIPSDIDCIREASLTLSGSIREPWFIMRFTDLAKQ